MFLATFNSIAPSITTILVLAGMIGGIFVFRNAKKTGIILIQDQTIVALNQRIDAQQEQINLLQKKNDQLEYVIDTISMSLKKKGILISVDGEMVTMTDAKGVSNVTRRPTRNTPLPGTLKKDDLPER